MGMLSGSRSLKHVEHKAEAAVCWTWHHCSCTRLTDSSSWCLFLALSTFWLSTALLHVSCHTTLLDIITCTIFWVLTPPVVLAMTTKLCKSPNSLELLNVVYNFFVISWKPFWVLFQFYERWWVHSWFISFICLAYETYIPGLGYPWWQFRFKGSQ